MKKSSKACAALLAVFAATSQAQDEALQGTAAREVAESVTDAPFYQGTYFAPMISYLRSDGDPIDNGYGASLVGGYRQNWYAFEFNAVYHELPSKIGKNAREVGGSLNGLVFPLESSPNIFLIAEVGGVELKNYATPPTVERIALTTFAAGAGDLVKLSVGDYEFAVRAEALYRFGLREANHRPSGDLDAPRHFNDLLVNVGLQLPIARKQPPPSPPPPAVVVPAPADSDGDGVIDESDHCPGTPAGTAVDAAGCPVKPPCKPPEAGQRMDLSGCAAGDIIVLQGVNFEFDKAALTVNAKTILDGVIEALNAVPALHFSVNGHTDAKGDDGYNQSLSERRAASVMQYLQEHGVAAERMTSAGFGETQPVADNETEEGRELNRRVELKITGSPPPA